MKMLLLALCAVATPVMVPLAAAAEATNAPAMAMECCNTVCPVCDKPIDTAVKPVEFKPSESVKHDHPGIESAMVGFCSEGHKMDYMKDPARYEGKVVPQWQQSKQQKIKSG